VHDVESDRGAEGAVTVEVGRVFDVPEAWLVRDTIARTCGDTRIVLDFKRTDELHDFALAVLIEALSNLRRKVEIRGLMGHHRALLRLLGSTVEQQAEAAAK